MSRYEVISFDMFQTLVDVNKRIPQIWKSIYGKDYTTDKAFTGANTVVNYFQKTYKSTVSSRFRSMEDVYLDCAKEAILELGEDIDPKVLTRELLYQHCSAPFYDDVLETFHILKKDYKIILCSDSNHIMVDSIINTLKFDDVFISEDLKCYKGEPNGRFFKEVLKNMQIKPSQILHVGDGLSDIVGANLAGVDSCLIDRNRTIWHREIHPTYFIKNLKQVIDIVNTTKK